MHLFYLTICGLFISSVATAQSDFQAGFYVLENDISVRHSGLIRAGINNLRVQADQGKAVTYPWADVHSYRIGMARYVKASGFTIQNGFSTREAVDIFVQLLDSGAVSLLRYEYAPSGGYVGFNGAPSLGPSSRPDMYLLQRTDEAVPIEIPYSVMDGSGKKFREALAPFIASRADLVKVLAAKKITVYNLETFIHAFNNHEPFLNYPMEGVQSNP
jgi:hypothetical protein